MARKSFENAATIFRQNGGILRTSRAKSLGVDQPILTQMCDAGLLVRETRGVYRLADLPPLSHPDFVKVAVRIPESVICLVSALSFHSLTTQIPNHVYIALPRAKRKNPRFDSPPLYIVYLSEKPYQSGIESHELDGVWVQIYHREKTVADCFKFRNKIGKDIALEALRDYLRLPDRSISKLMEYARINRVEKIMRPYVEVLA